MKKKLRRSGTAWAFLLSLLFALPLARPADAQENSSLSLNGQTAFERETASHALKHLD
jgi:hypothetical protein